MITLLASAARTSSGTATIDNLPHLEQLVEALMQLTVSAAATEASDTLDVFWQHSLDGGTTYDDVAHFTQVLGNGGAKKFIAAWARDISVESELHAPQDAAVAAGVVQGPIGNLWRLKWVVVDGGGGPASFTFKVEAEVKRRRR